LVDAQLINPDCAFHGALAEARKGSVEVMGDMETMSRYRDLSLLSPVTPHVAQSLKVFVAVQANDSDFTLYFFGLTSRQQIEDPYLTISGSMPVCHFQPNLEIDVKQPPTKEWESILHAIRWTAFLCNHQICPWKEGFCSMLSGKARVFLRRLLYFAVVCLT
jgi:hypothetical protein